jgi:hypothetical protein
LRRRFHHDFLDLAFEEPGGQGAELAGAGSDLPALEVILPVHFDVGRRDGQHLLVHINSGDPVRHRAFLKGAESVPCLMTHPTAR